MSEPHTKLEPEAKEAIRSYFGRLLVLPGIVGFLFSFVLGIVVKGSVDNAEKSAYNEAYSKALERLVEPTARALASVSAAEQARSDVLDLRSEMKLIVDSNRNLAGAQATTDTIINKLARSDDFAQNVRSKGICEVTMVPCHLPGYDLFYFPRGGCPAGYKDDSLTYGTFEVLAPCQK